MADQIKTPESGGGEGPAVVAPVSAQPAAETKPETAVEAPITPATVQELKTENLEKPKEIPEEIKPEKPEEIKPNETKDPEVKPASPAVQQAEQTKEVKLEEPKEIKQDIAVVPENKVEEKAAVPVELKQEPVQAEVEANGNPDTAKATNDQGDWQQRETELLKKIEELEKVKKERTQDSLSLELKVRDEEIDLLKARVKNLETELQAALSKPSGKNHEMIENIKQQHEELLSKARGMIFDKTKMVKNQELQIEALNTQIVSLKDINQITKDLLEIRNSEIKAMEDRLQAMEARFKAEKERYGLVLERAQTSSNINDDLRKEYETQLALFKQLREKYDQRVQALVAENERLKALIPAKENGPGTSG